MPRHLIGGAHGQTTEILTVPIHYLATGGTLVNFDNVGVRLVSSIRTEISCGPKEEYVA